MSLSFVFLDPAIIVLDVTCACGTPWAFLLTFFNKWCKMEDGNVAISLCLIILLVQHWEFDVTGGGWGDGCVRLILSIDHQSTHSSFFFRDFCDTELIMSRAHMLKNTPFSVGYDLPKEIHEARKKLWDELKSIKSAKTKGQISNIVPGEVNCWW